MTAWSSRVLSKVRWWIRLCSLSTVSEMMSGACACLRTCVYMYVGGFNTIILNDLTTTLTSLQYGTVDCYYSLPVRDAKHLVYSKFHNLLFEQISIPLFWLHNRPTQAIISFRILKNEGWSRAAVMSTTPVEKLGWKHELSFDYSYMGLRKSENPFLQREAVSQNCAVVWAAHRFQTHEERARESTSIWNPN